MKHLKELRNNKGLLQKDLANYLGIDRTTYVKYETGVSEPNLETLKLIADLFEVSTDYLIGKEKTLQKKGVRIPVYGTIAAGIPINAVDDIIDYEEISEAMASQGEYLALQIKGNSMEPRLRSGDVIIVRKQSDVDSGQTAAVMINGDEATCKIVLKRSNGIDLVSTNPDYPPMHYSYKQVEQLPVEIIGLVVEARLKSF